MHFFVQARFDPLNKRYVPILAIVVALVAVAVVGFLLPEEKQDVPARIVLDNAGGRVIFTHGSHVEEYGFDCADCHHDDIGQDKPIACGTCHPAAFDKTFRAEHQKAFPSDQACARCHGDVPQGKLTDEERPDIDSIPTRAEAFHKQCQSCHEENSGPYGQDACYECHAEKH